MTPIKLSTDRTALCLSESDVTKQITSYLRAHGWEGWRLHAGVMRGRNGSYITVGDAGRADWLFTRPLHECGRCEAFFLEAKGNGAKTNPNRRAKQQMWQEQMTQSGYLVVQVDSLDKFVDWYGANYER